MAAATLPLEARPDWQPAAAGSLGAAQDVTRDAIERAQLAAAVQGAAGLPAVLADAAAHVDPGAASGGDLPLVLAQHTTTPDGADGPRGRGPWPQVLATVLDGLTRGPMSPAEDLADVAGDPGVPPADRAHLREAAALAQAHPELAEAIRERAFHNLADRQQGGGGQVDLLTGDPLGPQVLPGRPIEEQGPQITEGPRIPDDQGPQVLPGPVIEEQGPQIQADPVQEPIHDGVWADPPADTELMGNGIVAMEDVMTDLSVPGGAMDTPEFSARAHHLAEEAGVPRPRLREGVGAARYELASGQRIERPDPPNVRHDYVDQVSGERIQLKGPVPGEQGEMPPTEGSIPDDRITGERGLAAAVLKDVQTNEHSDTVVVDVLGLSDQQLDRLRIAITAGIEQDGMLDGKHIVFVR